MGFLRDYLLTTGAKGYVLAVSGGQDSTLAGRLTQLAIESLRAEGHAAEFTTVRMPYRVQADEDDAQLALQFIRPDETVTVDIKPATDALNAQVASAIGVDGLGDFNKGNVKARLRMVAQYAIAGERGFLVIGTDHAAENITGFFTKFGDGAADLLPLAGRHERIGEVRTIGCFQAIEFVSDPETRERDTDLQDAVAAEAMRNGVIADSSTTSLNLQPSLLMPPEALDVALGIVADATDAVLAG